MKLKELYENWLTKNQKDSDGNVTIFANRFLDVLLIHKIINLGQAICVKSKRSMIDKNRVNSNYTIYSMLCCYIYSIHLIICNLNLGIICRNYAF